MNKNILFISPQPFFEWRGSPIRVHHTVQALSNQGYSVDLLTLPIGEKTELEGVNIIRVSNPFGVKKIPIGPSVPKLFFDSLILLKGISLVRKNKYAIIHGVEEGGFIAFLLSQVTRSKTIFEKHSDPESHKKGIITHLLLSVYSKAERLTVKHAQAVICTGIGLVDQVKKMGEGIPVFHISDIASAEKEPAVEETSRMRNQLQQHNGETLITYVGSFATYQGIDLLMESAKEVLTNRSGARFIIVGGNDAETSKWKSFFTKHGILDGITFLGMIPPDRIPIVLSASDILLSPRTSGVNTPLKLLDYLKAGRAIIASNTNANLFILNEDCAIFSNPDPASMAANIIKLIQNESERKALGQKARAEYKSKYTFSNYAKELQKCYEFIQKLPS